MSSNTSSYNKLVERLMSAHTSQKSMGDLQSIINGLYLVNTVKLGCSVPWLVRIIFITKFIKLYVFLCRINSVSTYTRILRTYYPRGYVRTEFYCTMLLFVYFVFYFLNLFSDDEISDSQADTTESADSRKGRSKTRNRNPADRIPRPSSFLFKGTGKNCRSHRRSRRYENAMYLATYVAETEEDFYNFDVTPEHNNAFTRLLQDPKQLQVGANNNIIVKFLRTKYRV